MSETVAEATARSVAAAEELGDLDAGAVAVLVNMAGMIDYLLANGGIGPAGKLDNVSIPTYLRYCESLGLTPAGRVKLGSKERAPVGKLAAIKAEAGKLRAV